MAMPPALSCIAGSAGSMATQLQHRSHVPLHAPLRARVTPSGARTDPARGRLPCGHPELPTHTHLTQQSPRLQGRTDTNTHAHRCGTAAPGISYAAQAVNHRER